MKLEEYQSTALLTAQEEAFDHAYLIPGIVGETGELFGHRAKGHWHGWDEDRLRTAKVGEYGDIAWMTAILLHTQGVAELRKGGHHLREVPPITVWGTLPDPWHLLLQKANNLYHLYSQQPTHCYIQGEAIQLWLLLERHCETITGASWTEVLQYNLDKLASRAERGVLRGAGDLR